MHPFHLVMICFQFSFQVSFEGDSAPMIRGSDRPGSVTIYRKGEEVRNEDEENRWVKEMKITMRGGVEMRERKKEKGRITHNT